jgi:hypothetical protein
MENKIDSLVELGLTIAIIVCLGTSLIPSIEVSWLITLAIIAVIVYEAMKVWTFLKGLPSSGWASHDVIRYFRSLTKRKSTNGE